MRPSEAISLQHGYFTVDLAIVWQTIQKKSPLDEIIRTCL
jgi:uncharacterized protein with HEPN domain